MAPKEFAKVLGINYGNFNTFKKGLHRVKILAEYTVEIEMYRGKNARELEIQSEIVKRIRPGTSITYSEFLEFYEQYTKDINQEDFLRLLGISKANFNNMKYRKRKARVLKFIKNEITPERKKEIYSEIKRRLPKGSIEYVTFLKLYEPYKIEMSEEEFADVLGISYSSYMHLKSGAEKATINFNAAEELVIRHQFKEAAYYSLQKLEDICNYYGITIDQLLMLLFNNNEYYVQTLKRTLYERGKIFVGKKQMDDEFIISCQEYLSKEAHSYSKSIGKIYHTSHYYEDIAQDALVWIFQTQGDVFCNLSLEEGKEATRRMLKVRIKSKHKERLKVSKDVSLNENITSTYKANDIKSVDANFVGDIVEDTADETPITIIQQCLINGMERDRALEYVMSKFGLNKLQLLQILEAELTKTKTIKTGADGKKIFGRYRIKMPQ